MFAVDANVLLYASNRQCAEHARCRALLRRWHQQTLPWFVSWGTLYEFIRVSTHAKVFPHPLSTAQALRFVEAILASRGLTILEHTPRHAEVLAQTLAEVPSVRGSLVHDAHLAVLMREHGVRRLYTRDADFARFRFLEILDPLDERT